MGGTRPMRSTDRVMFERRTCAMTTEEELQRLPLRAIVAYAARCARRVRPLYRLPQDFPDRVKHELAVDHAIEYAENFAAGIRSAEFKAAAVRNAADADAFGSLVA